MAGVEPQGEISAFNAGVRAVLDLAARTAASIDAITVLRPTRFNFAAEALRGLAEEGKALLKDRDGNAASVTADGPDPSLSDGPAIAAE